ncbi:MAG: Ig domain-containing protein [Acidobacteria bacterium]|nr:Ig domain-containing protein [Acidobacteriota bacterium]
MTASIAAADVASAGAATVTVSGGASGSATFTINNPAPVVSALSPASATAGSPTFTLAVNGSNFVAGSVVRWNGSGRVTTFAGATQLTAAILAADVATGGTPLVTVFNPAPGGGASNSLPFTINPPPVITTNFLLPGGIVGVPYSQALAASLGQPPYTWSSTTLPAGLALSAATGLLSGTPSTTGTFSITVTATDSSTPPQNEPAGFTSSPGIPNPSGNQWSALDAFVGKAESKGIFVALHFASGRFLDLVESSTDPETAATEFANWAGAFVQYLTPVHKNVLIWGLAWSVEPSSNDPLGSWSLKWQKAYKKLDDIARQSSPSPGTLGLIGADLSMVIRDPNDPTKPAADVLVRPANGYQWPWQASQQTAKTMHDLLTSIYGSAKDPDAYLMQLYTANATDIQNALVPLTTNTQGDPSRLAIPANKIFAVEWATSSAIGNPYSSPSGTDAATIGDAQTPTTTSEGQSQWLKNAICAYRNAGINKYAYWAMYDPYTLFSTSPWSKTGQDLAWWGFWGIINDSGVDKPGWGALANFYLAAPSSWACPSTPLPIVSVFLNDYFTLGQPVRATWTAADVTSMSLDRTHGGSYSCVPPGLQLSPTDMTGSCSHTDATAFSTTGTRTITLTGLNGPQSATASASFTVYSSPLVNAATNGAYESTVHTNDWIIVWGNGFSVTGGNSLQFTRPGYNDVWMAEGQTSYGFWDQSYRQINAELGGRLAAGTWTLYVWNGYSPNPSAAFTVTITQ